MSIEILVTDLSYADNVYNFQYEFASDEKNITNILNMELTPLEPYEKNQKILELQLDLSQHVLHVLSTCVLWFVSAFKL